MLNLIAFLALHYRFSILSKRKYKFTSGSLISVNNLLVATVYSILCEG